MEVDTKIELSAIEMLEDEHRLIMRMVKLLPIIQQRVEEGRKLPEVLMTIVDFFQVYTDKSHHAKEEEALFPLLAKRGVRLEGCPIGVLHNDHEQGRVLMKTLRVAIQSYVEGALTLRSRLLNSLRVLQASILNTYGRRISFSFLYHARFSTIRMKRSFGNNSSALTPKLATTSKTNITIT